MKKTYTVRFAPSPTGRLHKGHLFSAWFAGEFALEGKINLRVEDIDLTRCKPEFVELIFQDLATFNILYHEVPFYQSSRLADYQSTSKSLATRGFAYPCFCSRKQVAHLSAAHGPDGPIYGGHCKTLNKGEVEKKIENKEPYALRLDMEKAKLALGEIHFQDLKRGMFKVDFYSQGDPIIAGRDYPTSYHLSCVMDDALQKIDLITRGEDLLPACHIQRVLQELLSLPEPKYLHHPLVLDDEGKRLAKRSKSHSLDILMARGQTYETLRAEFDVWFQQFTESIFRDA